MWPRRGPMVAATVLPAGFGGPDTQLCTRRGRASTTPRLARASSTAGASRYRFSGAPPMPASVPAAPASRTRWMAHAAIAPPAPPAIVSVSRPDGSRIAFAWSVRVRVDPPAGGQGAGVVGGQGVGQHDEAGDPWVGHPVVGVPAGAADSHVAAVGQAGQVGGHPALRQSDVGDTLADG